MVHGAVAYVYRKEQVEFVEGIFSGLGMLRRAAWDFRLELYKSVLVDARKMDVAAQGRPVCASIPGVRIRAVDWRPANATVNSLDEVEVWLVEQGKGANQP